MQQIRVFGKTKSGETVREITLQNGAISCQILTFGATLRTLNVPSRTGETVDIVLGYDSLHEYERHGGYLGASIGRYANRIAQGRFTLNNQTFTLAKNDGENHLHGGMVGFSHRVWEIAQCTAHEVVLTLESQHMDEGYPAKLLVQATYRLEGTALAIEYRASSDGDTLCNLTNHSYFNLAGHCSGTVLKQKLAVYAQQYLPIYANAIPTGEIASVTGTPMDLRTLAPIGAGLAQPFSQLEKGHGFDHCYVIDGARGSLRPCAFARAEQTGIAMSVETTAPAVQLYTGNFLSGAQMGKGGCVYAPHHGFCLETQFYPDSPHHVHFPSCVLREGELWHEKTVYSFSAAK